MNQSSLFGDGGSGGGIYSRAGASHVNQMGRMENAHEAVDEILEYVLWAIVSSLTFAFLSE